jgi:5'-deoxynucleotidase YfbR-like HD superfamily hydrolase
MENIFEFLRFAEKLKCEKRDNKQSNGEYESVAGPSWMLGVLALLFHDKMTVPVDLGHALKITIVHDLAEALAGDVPLYKQCSEDARVCKAEREVAAMDKMSAILPLGKRDEIMSLWREYEDQQTPEARFIKACDKLEAFAQGLMFGKVGYWRDYGPDFYYNDTINRGREKFYAHEPAFVEFYELMRKILLDMMAAEGIDAGKYLEV